MSQQRDRVDHLDDADDGGSHVPHQALEHPDSLVEDNRSSTLDVRGDVVEGDRGGDDPDEEANIQEDALDVQDGCIQVVLEGTHAHRADRIRVVGDMGVGSVGSASESNAKPQETTAALKCNRWV